MNEQFNNLYDIYQSSSSNLGRLLVAICSSAVFVALEGTVEFEVVEGWFPAFGS